VTTRPHRNESIDALEALFRAGQDEATLLVLRDELVNRKSNRAQALLAKVEGALSGTATYAAADASDESPQTVSEPMPQISNRTIENPMTSQPTDSTPDDVEGLEPAEDASWGDYPIDTLLIRSENRTVHDILRRIEKGSFVMDPDFQRDFIWKDDKQSKLIESVLLRIPLPVLYLAEDEAGRMIVVDGLQRLSTFQRYVNNELRLRLPGQPEINNKKFQDLSPKLQNRVEDCNLLLYVIDAKVPERARLDIFERVNGGIPLTRQQMRNCLFVGDATRFLKQAAKSELFLKATGDSLNSLTMRDREFVNRFCAFQILPIEDYRGDMDEFLAQALRQMNAFPKGSLERLSFEFQTGLENNYRVFGKHAFRKHAPGKTSRSVINASLWDVMSTGLSHVPPKTVEKKAEELRTAFYALLDDDAFNTAVTYATNDLRRVRYRFEVTRAMFKEVLGAD
jgi:hypothetical protein